MKLLQLNKYGMKQQDRTARTKMVLGLNLLGCLAFIIFMLLANMGHAVIPLNYVKGDSTKRYKSKTKSSYSFFESNGHHWRSKNNFSSTDIQYRGDISVNDTDTDVTAISPGGYLKIKKTTFGNTRSIIIESNSSGELSKEYYEGRKKMGFNEEGRKWLADILLDVVRHTGIAAEARVQRFYKQGGTSAVLSEIKQIDSNSGKGRYFKELVGVCSEKDMPEVAKKVGLYITSNSVRGELYREYADKFLASPEATRSFFEGVGYMTSNTERSSILRHVLRKKALDDKSMAALLQVARRMTSNTERGAILREVNEQFPETETGVEAYFDVISSMTSNTEKGNVLRHLLRQRKNSEKVMKMVLEAVDRHFTSNTEMGSVLRTALPSLPDKPVFIDLYLDATNRMTSNTERGNALYNLLTEQNIKSTDAQIAIFRSIRRMTSNTEKSRVLRRTISYLNNNPGVDDAFFDAVSSMTSNTEKGHILRSVINKSNTLSPEMSMRILDATRYFTSNTEMGNTMVALSRVMPKNNEKVKEAYQQAARRLSSNTEYRRVIESLNR